MSESLRKDPPLTSTAFKQSDEPHSDSVTMSPNNETTKISFDEMVEIIKLKDSQIIQLQSTIEQQSIQIQRQCVAIEDMQKQITRLSDSISALAPWQSPSVQSPALKLAPIFTSKVDKQAIPQKRTSSKKNKTPAPMATSCHKLIQPHPKRPRHLLEAEDVEQTNDGSQSDAAIESTSTVSQPSNVLNVTDDMSKVNNNTPNNTSSIEMNTSTNLSNDNSLNNESSNELNEPNNFGTNESCNVVNFKKNAIVKEKNVTPIEISIKNNEKGSLHALLLKHFDNNTFLWSNVGKNSVRVNPFTLKVKDSISKWLHDRKYQFHTFLNKEEKPNAFIIRGLPDSITKQNVASALQQAGIQFNSIERHSTGYTRSHHLISDLWRVTTPNCVMIQHFKSIDGIMNVKIRVEILRRSPVVQCKNCQLFFHSAIGCYRKFRCVKCDKDHPPAACPRDSDKSLPVACCNCHQNHSANDLQNCQYFNRHIKPILDKREKERSKSSSISSKFISSQETLNKHQNNFKRSVIKPNVSFSSIVAENHDHGRSSKTPASNKSSAISTKMSTSDLKNLLLQNMQLMSAHQELMKKLSCLVE